MESAQKYVKTSILILVIVSAVLAVLSGATGAVESITQADPFLLALGILFFLISVKIWLFSWAYLVSNHSKKPLLPVYLLGLCSVFGSLTPIQLGSDALRSLFLKEHMGIGLTESFSASMIVKGLKFSVLAISAFAVILLAASMHAIEPVLLIPLLSGLLVVFLAAALFLLPLRKGIGFRISRIFGGMSKRIHFLKPLEIYFVKYSDYLGQFSTAMILAVFLASALSWIFEFLSLQFIFLSIGIEIPLISLLVLFVLLAVLERAPILPRGILLVEAVGFAFLSFPFVSSAKLSTAEIASVLVLYDIARLIVPVVLSLAFYFVYGIRLKKSVQVNS